MALPEHVELVTLEPLTSDAWGRWCCASCGSDHHVLDSQVARVRRIHDGVELSVVVCARCSTELEDLVPRRRGARTCSGDRAPDDGALEISVGGRDPSR